MGGGRFSGLILTSGDKNVEASYIMMRGDYYYVKDVSKGEEILLSGEGEIANLGVNMIVSIQENSSGEAKTLDLG